MNTSLNDYLNYTKAERKGIYLLTFLFFTGIAIYFSLPSLIMDRTAADLKIDQVSHTFKPHDNKSRSEEKGKLIPDTLSDNKNGKEKRYYNSNDHKSGFRDHKKLAVAERKKSNVKNYSYKNTSYQNKSFQGNTYPKKSYKKWSPELKPFDFNPNTISKDELLKMNVSYAIINTLDKYRNKGGQFKTKKDLKKIYTMTDSIYQILQPFIQLPESVAKSTFTKPKSISTISFYDINTATAEELQGLKGIGPVLSKRIIKFRDKLGGFHSIDQIKSTYGLEDSVYQNILPFLQLSKTITEININKADFNELNSHPYISFQLAKVIINYRDQHGQFTDVNELQNIKILSAEKFKEIEPYLSVN